MAVDKRLSLTYALTNLFFIASGAVTVAISVIWKADAINDPSHIPVLIVLTVSRRTYRTTYHLPHDADDDRSCCRYRHIDRRLILITTYSPFLNSTNGSSCNAKFAWMVTYSLLAMRRCKLVTPHCWLKDLDINPG
jgi:hypothetical protein